MDDHFADCHKDIEEIPELVEKLIESRNPRFRNIPDIESRFLYTCRRLLPFSLYSFLLNKGIYKGLKKFKVED